MSEDLQHYEIEQEVNNSAKARLTKLLQSETFVLIVLFGLVVLIWSPRLSGPIDLRWDGSVYYTLGTSLAEGKGYKLLNEPGEIDAVQYPPLLPLIIAGHQWILGTNDPTTVGKWLRYSFFIIFIVYIYAVFRFFKVFLSILYAFIATIICLFSLYVYFLSDLLVPEILFSLGTILFILGNRKDKTRAYSILTYIFAVISYSLRTIGIAAFAVWILESLVKKRFKQAAVRLILALIPIVCWQFYISSVESSYQYNHPAYAYQRAPYLYYNVSYARNIALKELFAPEKGEVTHTEMVKRFFRNAIYIPVNLGESLTTNRGHWRMFLDSAISHENVKSLSSWGVFFVVFAIGFFVLGGLILQLFQHQWIIPLYVFIYLSAICLTPFPNQFGRYLMPIVPFLALSFIVFLLFIKNALVSVLPLRWSDFGIYLIVVILSGILLIEMFCLIMAYRYDYKRVEYFDRNNQSVGYRMLFYNNWSPGFNRSVAYVSQNAKPGDIVAADTPHWIYLQTGLKAVMPPFEKDTVKAQELLDTVPVTYLILSNAGTESERYTLPVVRQFPDKWKQVYFEAETGWSVYQRINR